MSALSPADSRSVFADGRLHFGVGIEDTFVPQVRPGHRALDEYVLTGHDQRWSSDLVLAAATGAQTIRWGVPWYRVEPEPGRFVWDWLDRVVDRLVELGLVPVVDLVHYGAPLWLDNQALNTSYADRVADYAHAVAARYADRLSHYTPVNEPSVHAEWCGETGAWPPYLTGDDGWVKIARGVARGLAQTQQAVAAAVPGATFVHVEAGLRYEGRDGEPAGDDVRLRSRRDLLVEDLVCGLVDDDHPMTGYLLQRGFCDHDLDWHRGHPTPPDVMGVNYYPHLSTGVLDGSQATGAPPRGYAGVAGLEEVLHRFHDRYGRPVAVTETSTRGDAPAHVAWLEESVACVDRLRAASLPVVGYTWFPLFDLLDWSYRTGSGPPEDYLEPLGLYTLHPTADGLERRPTEAVDRFAALARDHHDASQEIPA